MTSNSFSRRSFIASAGVATGIAMAGCLGGDDDFPGGDMSIIVPYDSGSNTDADVRAMAPIIEDELDTSVAVENLDGAGGLRGLGDLYSGDEGKVGFGYVPSNVVSFLNDDPGWDFEDLVGIGGYSTYAVALIANPDYEIEDLDDLYSRYETGELSNVGGLSLGHAWHVLALLLRETEGWDWESWVNYGGGPEIVASVSSDEVPVALVSEDNVLPEYNEGNVDYIACLGSSGTELTPDEVPTWVDDLGNEDYDYMSMVDSTIYASPATTDDQQEILEDAFEAATLSDEFAEYSEDREQIVQWKSGAELEEDIQQVLNDLPDQVDLDNL